MLRDGRAVSAQQGGEFAARQVDRCGAQGREQRRVERAHGSNSSEKSIARAECVSAPTEMKSTPVAAICGTVSRVTPPLASNFTLPAPIETASAMSAQLILSSRITSIP